MSTCSCWVTSASWGSSSCRKKLLSLASSIHYSWRTLGIMVCATHSKFKTKVEFSVLPEAPLIAGWKVSTNGSEKRKRSNLIICLHGKTTAQLEHTPLRWHFSLLPPLKVNFMNKLVLLLWRLWGLLSSLCYFYLSLQPVSGSTSCFFFILVIWTFNYIFHDRSTFLFSKVFFFKTQIVRFNLQAQCPSQGFIDYKVDSNSLDDW